MPEVPCPICTKQINGYINRNIWSNRCSGCDGFGKVPEEKAKELMASLNRMARIWTPREISKARAQYKKANRKWKTTLKEYEKLKGQLQSLHRKLINYHNESSAKSEILSEMQVAGWNLEETNQAAYIEAKKWGDFKIQLESIKQRGF